MTQSERPIIIGTRGSKLAMWQARETERRIDLPCEIRVVKTSGDRFLDIPLQGRLEKGFFTKEIEEKLLSGEIDIAVHSLKDLPTESHPELCIGAYLERAPVSDLLLVHPDWHDDGNLIPLRPGCPVGATSLRRQALLKMYAPYVEAAFLRGNVPTRIHKCRDKEYGAIILARAGVDRLAPQLDPLLVYEFDPETWLPAPGQGAVAVQTRTDDRETPAVLADIDHAGTRLSVEIERRLLANFEGGCHTAFGAWAKEQGEEWEVLVGLERPEGGWGHKIFTGSMEICLLQGPDTLAGFEPKSPEEVKPLCLRIR